MYIITTNCKCYFSNGVGLTKTLKYFGSDFLVLLGEQSIGSLQKKYSIGSFELLSKTAPIQALSLLILGPFIDYFLTGKILIDYKLSSGAFVSAP